MPRDIVLGNGSMLVNLDRNLSLRDLYYPFVGMENHIAGGRCLLGVWVDGQFSWVQNPQWQKEAGYVPGTLISLVRAVHSGLGLEVTVEDAVHYRQNLFLRRIHVRNRWRDRRELRLFFVNDFHVGGWDIGDTALYDPISRAVCHYKRDYYFYVSGNCQGQPIYQYHVQKRFGGREGSARDAEDGVLSGNPIDQGSVDSTISFRAALEPEGEVQADLWIAAGRSLDEVRNLHAWVADNEADRLMNETASFWRHWLALAERDWADLPAEVVALFKTSLLVTRTQIDNNGAVLAANDTDILSTNRDHYSYVWPRDGALVARMLDGAGYHEITAAFYRFCARTISREGYFYHKYNPDGTVGSSWHPWTAEVEEGLPIQEDGTGLVLWGLWKHFEYTGNVEFLASLYLSVVKPAADFMVRYREPRTGLPHQSFDLWEERKGVFTFTAAAVWAGLTAAARCARLLGDGAAQEKWEEAAGKVHAGILRELFDPELNRFIRGRFKGGDGSWVEDHALDASLYWISGLGVLPPDDPRVKATMQAVAEGLWVKTDIGGVARYANDYYFKRSDDIEKVPGNPWFICTLWLANWYVDSAETPAELAKARELLKWAHRYRLDTGILPEQVHPYTGEPLSVAPLTWSHATFCQVVLSYLAKWHAFRDLPLKPESGYD
ncbi:glycoside hydrolase family 15 protein [Candidatus Desulforudis audaxviator]|uniref:Glycoside hydrolase 15-related n=1 Tax=Desulforudis audaxviator (strain MP104C) TaxID=477974 RepID=B1I3I7_DESAP|nr:glycoside hydrolase family 15 protein [Candidatus Desulforudis audaxviator]ACA59559.1 glycoside hydrolase 15-related [Candidatus Desulforudis audaxviator MP104C]AZK59543.1 Glucoamylase [Candidatus Desulforudis audaxviator]